MDEFYGALLIPEVLYDDVSTMSGPANQKASKITRELMRGIENSKSQTERLEKICQIFLKLEDEKLKEIVKEISERMSDH